jgi:NADH:ubiquinone oxidoreductase subunit K
MIYRKVFGSMLAMLVLLAAVMAVLGIWGLIGEKTAVQLVMTFGVTFGAVMGLSYVAEAFFGKPKDAS